MKNKVLTSFGALLISFYCSGQSSLLWKISGNNLKEPSYIFGTIHLIPKKDYFFNEQSKDLLQSCGTLALEIDLDALTLQQKIDMAKKAVLPSGTTLPGLMGQEKFDQMKNFLISEYGIKEKRIAKYERIKPFFLSGIIIKDRLGKVKTYETELLKYAKKAKLKTMGLETIEDQLSIVEKIPLNEQVEQFMNMEDLKEYDKLLEIYKTEDLDALYKMASETMDEGDFEEDFINKRNRKWIVVLKEQMPKESTFIAVGALHLPGENGVIELLKKEGFELSPVLSDKRK
ncbi:MAG: TraB/GumN family protein [Flavobacteriales bacterium]|nr:TraB/GumN family protein [Flavobacteriales bacterium]